MTHNMENAKNAYFTYLETERRMSPNTIGSYKRDLQTLSNAFHDSLDAVETHDIRRLVARLHASGLSGKTLSRMLSSWRGFFRFLNERFQYKNNPCVGIRAPKTAKRLPDTLTPDEITKLLELATDDERSSRDWAMFELFYSSGLRVSELATLKFLDLDLKDHTVRVTGKGNKTRVVPIGRKAVDAINHWLHIREAAGRGIIKFLFPNNQGEPLSVRTIQYRLTYWSKKQGLPQNVHPHMLRHSFASHILQSSGDLRSIQEMLGHANISTTQVYTHLDWQHLAQTYDNAHPRAKRKENN